MLKVGVTWVGLPDYAARCLRAFINDTEASVDVISTRPGVPIKGMEESLGKPIHWIDENESAVTWSQLGLDCPDILLTGGYYKPAFRTLAHEVKQNAGKTILASDNNWQPSLKQRLVDRAHHFLVLQRQFDGVLTTGESGIRYSLSMGYSSERIAAGLYGADPSLFFGGVPLSQRPKRILFVGQLIKRKNVLGACDAFLQTDASENGWTLQICGSGPLRGDIPKHPAIEVMDFVQPPQLAELMRHSRCLILPSFEEHWGLVVHEAALCGCALALADTVGAVNDLATPTNGLLFRASDVAAIAQGLQAFTEWNDTRWADAEAQSRELATRFGPHRFSSELRGLIARIQSTP